MNAMGDTDRAVQQRPAGLDVAGWTVPAAIVPCTTLVVEVLKTFGLEIKRIHQVVAILRVKGRPLFDIDLEELRRTAIL